MKRYMPAPYIVLLQEKNSVISHTPKTLGDETRQKIVEFLIDGEKCVCEIDPLYKKNTINL